MSIFRRIEVRGHGGVGGFRLRQSVETFKCVNGT